MATLTDAGAVKSLNTSAGRGRFIFKSFSQRIEEIEVDVFRSLDPLKAEPSKGSSFFRDTLADYKELNTAEDFISFYDEVFPIVQTLPQIILQREFIIYSLLSRLKMKGRLSYEPILRLIAALSRDLLKDFIPFLKRIVDSLEILLESGADRDPEAIEQIFTSWFYIMLYLQKYLTEYVDHVLRDTTNLRYHRRDYVREFMAESLSFLLRKIPLHQQIKGMKKLMAEVIEEPSERRKSAVGALLYHVMRSTSSRLHSKTEKLLPLLVNDTFFQVADQSIEGSRAILEVLILVFERLCAELDPQELTFIRKCLCENITHTVSEENFVHLSRLVTLLIPMVQNDNHAQISDYEAIVEIVGLLVQTLFNPLRAMEIVDTHTELVDRVLELMLCIICGLASSRNMTALGRVSSNWVSVFDLRSLSLLTFIEGILSSNTSVLHVFGTHIICALSNLIEICEEEALYIMVKFYEKLDGESSKFLGGASEKKISLIHNFFEKTLLGWTEKISESVKGNAFHVSFQQNELAVLWGVVRCYPHFPNADANPSLLMDLINAIDELLMMGSKFTGFQGSSWHSLIGAALRSYHKLVFSRNAHEDSVMTKFLYLTKRYKLAPKVLSAVADILDSISASSITPDRKCQNYLPDYIAANALDTLDIFADNLCHANKEIRLSTLRILCHYEPNPNNVLNLLRLIEETVLSPATSRTVVLIISEIHTRLNARSVAEQYMPFVLKGIIGIFHNRFSDLENPALECLTVLIGQYFRLVWSSYIKYLDDFQTIFLTSDQQHGEDDISDKDTGLVGCFNTDTITSFNSTPCATVLFLLIQTLQRVPAIVESHSQQIVPLFLKFLGYDVDKITSNVASHTLNHEGKEWRKICKQWLSLFRLFRNPKDFNQSQFLRNVLQYRLLVQNDADLQMAVLDCLLNWKDDFLLPYSENLKNLINSKVLKDELTRWSLSSTSMEPIDVRHRPYVVPIVIQILVPKVRNSKMLRFSKTSSAPKRGAVLGFLAQLDVDELPLFFRLLIEPLLLTSQCNNDAGKMSLTLSCEDRFDTSEILKHLSTISMMTLSWKKRCGLLHVIEDILKVFDEQRINPFLNLLMHLVVRILASCTSSFGSGESCESSSAQNCSSFDAADHDDMGDKITERKVVKQFKDLRSLCLRIMHLVLCKYTDHDFGGSFWDTFFTSIKPLTANFKQEGASSKEPSSLFNCFLAMSKNYKLVPLLEREESLVPDIFSMLDVPSASETILSNVLDFIKNLLELDSGLGSEDLGVKRLLLPHLDVLICSLHSFFTNANVTKRKLAKSPTEREFTIFNLLTKYIHDASAAKTFIDTLLPLLTKRTQNFDTCSDVLQIIRQVVTVIGSGSSRKILDSITPLLISAGLSVRNSICDVLDSVAENDSSVLVLAEILRELNATSEVEVGALDYDKVLGAYDKVTVRFFYTLSDEHVLPILAHCAHDMLSEEMILRQSAFRLLLSFVEFSGEIHNGSLKSEQIWSKASIQRIVNNFFLKHMGNAMGKEGAVRKVWIDLLREMVLKIPNVANLDSFRVLCSDDGEQDFFSNIVHLQKHRRAKAVSRFGNVASLGNLSEVITNKVFVPLFFSMLFDAEAGKDEHIRSACVDALASISGCMKWDQYYALLLGCFRDLRLKPDKQKVLLRLICSIIDNFHFSDSSVVYEANASASDPPDPYMIDMTSSSALTKCTSSVGLPFIQACLHKKLFPKIQKLLASNSDNVNVNISLAALKILKLLPGDIMDTQLPTILHRISNFLKHRLDSVRDEARSALAVCLKELGLEYLQFIVKVLRGTLKRGYEMHVLGYTLNFLLSKFLTNPISGKLDYCLGDLVSVVQNDILGDVSEEKDVDKIASKMKETRKQKSYETLKLISQSITFNTHSLKLLSAVTDNLHKQLSPKVTLKLENMLNYIAAGLVSNPSVSGKDLFTFVEWLIKDGICDEGNGRENSYVSRSKVERDNAGFEAVQTNRLVNVDRQFSHLMTAFALGVLQNYMKTLKLNTDDITLLSLLEPLVSLLVQCLSSKYENIVNATLRCLALIVRLPLPSLDYQSGLIKNTLLDIAHGSVSGSSQLTESCLKLLTTLLRNPKVTLSSDQLHMLIQFPLFVDLAKNPTFVALSLLKAIINRKLVVPEIYDVVQIVAELMVQNQHEPIRKKCGQIFLQFLLGYHISVKRLQQHLDFIVRNLRYEHSTGKESVLEIIHTIIQKFSRKDIEEQSQPVFVYLVMCLTNDNDNNVRTMASVVIKYLIGHVSSHSHQSFLKICLIWYLGGKQILWTAAAQALGLLLEVIGNSFEKHLSEVFPVIRSIFQSAASAVSSTQENIADETVIPFWKEAYYSMVLLKKILNQFHNLFFDRDLEDIWATICEFQLHPHLWIRSISNRILSGYFTVVTDARRDNKLSTETLFLMKPSILFHTAVSLCCQLKVPLTDDTSGAIVLQNLVFSIRELHSILEKPESMDVSKFWSNLDQAEQNRFVKAFGVLDSRKGRRVLTSLTCDASGQQNKHHHSFMSFLLQRMGKIAFQMDANQMKVVFNCFKLISPKLLGCYGETSPIDKDDLHGNAYQMLLPLYRVSEGFTGTVVSDDLKQLAQEISESIRGIIGMQNYVQVFSQIRKNLKVKREKRKQGEKVMAVVNPTRNAKRKLRMADKHRAHKKRKIMQMKVGRWMR